MPYTDNIIDGRIMEKLFQTLGIFVTTQSRCGIRLRPHLLLTCIYATIKHLLHHQFNLYFINSSRIIFVINVDFFVLVVGILTVWFCMTSTKEGARQVAVWQPHFWVLHGSSVEHPHRSNSNTSGGARGTSYGRVLGVRVLDGSSRDHQ